ncbi:MAG: hypothetical protein M3065_06225, partial [Actinomycetota bacterium]|nr:hypothetical protein [Actinomycetota bacterium]
METFGRVEHDPRPLNLLPRALLGPREPLKLTTLLVAQFDSVTGRTRHHHQDSTSPPQLLHRISNMYLRTALL